MAPALGLSLYLLANRGRGPEGFDRPTGQRPEGVLLWIVAEPPTEDTTCLKLAEAALEAGLCDHVLLSGLATGTVSPAQTTLTPAPQDLPDQVPLFLDLWRPDAALILGDVLRPVCLSDLHERKVPVVLANAARPGLPDGRSWYPGLVSALLVKISAIHVTSDTAMRAFRKAGARPDQIHPSAPLDEDGHCLTCTEAERTALAEQFGTRPVWLAANVPAGEDKAVLGAHLTALRTTHRLLLLLVPDDPARAEEIARSARDDHGLSVARRSLDEDPGDDVQVYLADTEGEYGLWYRLAPLCYMGGTLSSGADRTLRHPFEPAALGSAILHGPFLGPQERPYVRLRAAGATRIVPSQRDLGETVSQFLEPDRAARLAQAAWALLARSAEASDDLFDTLSKVMAALEQT